MTSDKPRVQLSEKAASVVLLLVQGTAAGLSLLCTLVLTHVMAPDAYGHVMSLLALASVLSVVATLNVEAGAFRFLTASNPTYRRRYLQKTRALTITLGVFIGVSLVAFHSGDRVQHSLVIAAALVPALALVRLSARHGVALGRSLSAVATRMFTRPFAFSIVIGAAALGVSPSIDWILATYLVLLILGFLLQKVKISRAISETARDLKTPSGYWLTYGFAFAPSLLLLEYHKDFVVLVASQGLAADEIARLSLAFTMLLVSGLPLIAVEVAFAKKLSLSCLTSEHDAVAVLRKQLTLRCLGGVFGIASLLTLAPILIKIASPAYGSPSNLLPVMMIVPIVRAITGNPIQILSIVGDRRAALIISFLSMPLYGIGIGFAAETGDTATTVWVSSIGFLIIWSAFWAVLWLRHGIDSSALTYLLQVSPARDQEKGA